MVIERISIVPHRKGVWAIKHGKGYLGFSRTEDEALSIARDLVDWLSTRGRPAELHIERSFSPAPRKNRSPAGDN